MNSAPPWPSRLLRALVGAMRGGRLDDASRDFVQVLVGHGLQLILGLVSSAALARALGPAQLSIFAIVSAALMIAIALADFGLSNSAVRFVAADVDSRLQLAQRMARTFAVLKSTGTLVVVVATLLLAVPLAAGLGLPVGSGPSFVRLAALGIFATGCSGIVAPLLQALRRFPQLIAMQTVNSALTAILMGTLFLAGRLTVASALLVGAVTALAAALAGWGLLRPGWRQVIRLRLPLYREDARRLWHFGRWLWLSTILIIVFFQLDLLLLNRWADPTSTGHYALALNLALKAHVLNQTLHTVLLPGVSALSGRAQFAAYARRSLVRSGLLVLLLLLALPLARPFILAVYGVAYAPSVSFFYLLAGVIVVELLLSPLLLLAYPLNMSRQIAASNLVRVLAMLLAASLLIPAWGGSGAALARLVATVAGALFLGVLLLGRLRQEEVEPRGDKL